MKGRAQSLGPAELSQRRQGWVQGGRFRGCATALVFPLEEEAAGSFASEEKGAQWLVAKILSSCPKWE